MASIAGECDLEKVHVTPCTLRIGQIWGYHTMEEGDILMEYLGTRKDGVHVRRWHTVRRQKGHKKIVPGDQMTPELTDVNYGAGVAAGIPLEEFLDRVQYRAVLGTTTTGRNRPDRRKLIAQWKAVAPLVQLPHHFMALAISPQLERKDKIQPELLQTGQGEEWAATQLKYTSGLQNLRQKLKDRATLHYSGNTDAG